MNVVRSDRPSDWLKGVILPTGLVVMDTCWAYPWALLLGRWLQPSSRTPLLSSAEVFGLLVVSQFLTRLVLRHGWSLSRSRVTLLSLGFVSVLVAVRLQHFGLLAAGDAGWLYSLLRDFVLVPNWLSPPFVALALGFLLWWRGLSLGRGPASYESVEGAFSLGVALLVALFLGALAFSPDLQPLLQAEAGAYIVGYFLAGLTSLSLARLQAVRERGRDRQGQVPAFNRQWLTVMLGVVVGMLAVTLGLAQVLSFDLIAAIGSPLLSLLASAAWLVFYIVAVPIGYVLEVIILLLRQVLHPQAAEGTNQFPQAPSLDQFRQGADVERALPPEVVLLIKLVFGGLAALGLLLLLARSLRRWHEWERDDEVVEEREIVVTWGALGAAFINWLRSLLGRLLARPAAPIATSEAEATPLASAETAAVLTIRQVYRELLRLGSALGVARAPSATPYEHLPRLRARLGSPEDIAAITEAYVRARYGAEPPEDSESEEARLRWRQIQESHPPGRS